MPWCSALWSPFGCAACGWSVCSLSACLSRCWLACGACCVCSSTACSAWAASRPLSRIRPASSRTPLPTTNRAGGGSEGVVGRACFPFVAAVPCFCEVARWCRGGRAGEELARLWCEVSPALIPTLACLQGVYSFHESTIDILVVAVFVLPLITVFENTLLGGTARIKNVKVGPFSNSFAPHSSLWDASPHHGIVFFQLCRWTIEGLEQVGPI